MKALFTLSTNIIPEMEFERQFMAASGTTLDQTRFALAFIGALLSGFLIRFIPGAKGESSPQFRAKLSSFLAMLTSWVYVRWSARCTAAGPVCVSTLISARTLHLFGHCCH